MRILVANKFWYRRGGLERVMFDEIAWLEAAGHEVAHFSARHPDNIESPWADYFAPYLELGGHGGLSLAQKAVAAQRLFNNRTARDAFARLLDDFRPDLVHVHGIHRQLSPSILAAARERGVPVVQTVHDYHHVCPGDYLLAGGVRVCHPRKCGRLNYTPAIRDRCVKGSLAASALSAAETFFQRVRGIYEHTVRRFISPSRFLAAAMRQGDWKIPCDVIPNAVPLAEPASQHGDYFLYAGRLSQEKGVEMFLAAARMAGVRVIVAGDGPLRRDLESRCPDADFLGRVDGAAVTELVRGSIACVVPSVLFENAPMSVLEPMAAGVPVVASAIGGIPEIVRDEVDGILVEPGDVAQLAQAMSRLQSDPALRSKLGQAARARVAADFNPERHVALLLETYRKAIEA